MINELIGILVGAIMEYVPESYREIVLSVSVPAYVGILFVFVLVFLIWMSSTLIKSIACDR